MRRRFPALHRRRAWPLILALGAIAPASGVQAGDRGVSWSYTGERGSEHWGELAPAFKTCSQGTMQSPIDLRSPKRTVYVPLMFQYRSQGIEAVNDGRDVKILVPPGSRLHIRGDAYDLVAVHFHVPGEHRIEGVGFAAEIQLEHRGRGGQTLIVAIPLRPGLRFNSMLERIVERLPTRAGEIVSDRMVGINPVFLVPSRRDYYLYDGSLDMPPCSEPVRWIVMADPLEVDASLIQRLARATGSNARGVQPDGGRAVFLATRGR